MDSAVSNIPLGAGAVAVVFLLMYLVLRKARTKKNAAAGQAALAFRNRVLAQLEGLYPVPRAWSDEAYKKFTGTIPAIESAAAEFRVYVPDEKKSSFDTALKKYCEHCREITWQSCATFGIIPEMTGHDDVGPKEIFRQNVNTLLSFAKQMTDHTP